MERAQTMLLRRMGLLEPEEQLSPEAMDAYLRLFSKPMAPHHIKAVAALFDPDGAAFDEPANLEFGNFSLPGNVEPCGA